MRFVTKRNKGEDLVNIITRVLVKYLTPYSTFKKAVNYHIPHPHSKEMVEKSEVVSD